ncbi:MAG TPA: ATP-binding protein [Planctomycetota bacterium]|nr:ATP-binding protein [Planctomycetota bacterium]
MNERDYDLLRQREFALREVIAGARCVLWEARVVQRPDGHYAWKLRILSPESTREEFGWVRMNPDDDNETYRQRIAPEEMDRMNGVSHRALSTGQPGYQQEFALRAADNSLRYMSEYVRIIPQGPGIFNLYGVQVDITERKKQEEELRKREEELRQAKVAEAVGHFAMGAAHYFGNLMNVIRGYSALMKKCVDRPEDQKRNIEMIEKVVARAAGLNEQLLAMSELDSTKPAPTDVNAVVTETYRLLKPLVGEDIEFITLLATDLGPVLADAGQLEQALINMAINARQAMPGGGKLIIETVDISIDGSASSENLSLRNGPHVLLVVSDTGAGMTEEVRARLFEPFFSTRGVARGTGLGLAMIHTMVRRWGGDISVASVPDQGTRIKIYLPRIAQSAQ